MLILKCLRCWTWEKIKHKYTKEQDNWLKENSKGVRYKDLANMFNKRFGVNLTHSQINKHCNKIGYPNKLTGAPLGHNAWNKGLKGVSSGGKQTQFKKGDIPPFTNPLGSEYIDSHGYIKIKVKMDGIQRNRWKLKHKYVWENTYGKIKSNEVIIFADGNRQNVELDNLLLLTRKEMLEMGKTGMFFKYGILTKISLNYIRLRNKRFELEKRFK